MMTWIPVRLHDPGRTFQGLRGRMVIPLLAVLVASTAGAQLQIVPGSSTLGGITTSFPATAIGASSTTLNVQVQTNVSLSITGVTAATSQGGKQEYVVGALSGCTLGSTVPAGTVCTVPVTFTPAYPGRRKVPLQFVTTAGNINFGLTGIGLGALVTLTPGIISTFAGTTVTYPDPGPGDGGLATKGRLYAPYGLAVDPAGNVYITDGFNNTVRKVDAVTGIISTIAGVAGTSGNSGDGGPATSVLLNFPGALAIDAAGRLYIADQYNDSI